MKGKVEMAVELPGFYEKKHLQIIKPDLLDSKAKWTLGAMVLDKEVEATIMDKAFLTEVKNRNIGFTNGDYLVCDILIFLHYHCVDPMNDYFLPIETSPNLIPREYFEHLGILELRVIKVHEIKNLYDNSQLTIINEGNNDL